MIIYLPRTPLPRTPLPKYTKTKMCFRLNGLHMRATDAPIAANCIEVRCGSNGTSPGVFFFFFFFSRFCLGSLAGVIVTAFTD